MAACTTEQGLIDSLPPLSRLALAYAPDVARNAWLTVLALDARLAGIVRQAREPMLAQLRLAWWRDRLLQSVADRPKGEPLLAHLAQWPLSGAECVPLVDGWEALLSEPPLDQQAFIAFADGRVAVLKALALRLGVNLDYTETLARRWALADLAAHMQDPQEQERALAMITTRPSLRGLCPKALRPLAILEYRAVSASRGGNDSSLLSFFRIMRMGLIGF